MTLDQRDILPRDSYSLRHSVAQQFIKAKGNHEKPDANAQLIRYLPQRAVKHLKFLTISQKLSDKIACKHRQTWNYRVEISSL